MPLLLLPAIGGAGYLWGRSRSTSLMGKALMVAGGLAVAYGGYRAFKKIKKG